MEDYSNRIKNVGKTLHEMRKSKNLSLSDFSEFNLSPSFLSRVENGESGISFDRLYILLKRMDISFIEFINEAKLNTYLEFTTAYHNINIASDSRNLTKLTTLLHMYQNLHHDTGEIKYDHLAIITEAKINNFTSTHLSKDKIEKLSDHLFNLDTWYQYDLMLLDGTIRQLPLHTASIFVNELFRRLDRQPSDGSHTDLIFQIINHLIFMFINYNDFNYAQRTIEHLQIIITNSSQAHYSTRTRLLFYDGLLKIVSGDQSGVQQCQKAIEIISLLDNRQISIHYQQYLNNFIQMNSTINHD